MVFCVHECFKDAAGQDIFSLDWRQVVSYAISFLNIRLVVNSVINLGGHSRNSVRLDKTLQFKTTTTKIVEGLYLPFR
jgi:hypothetical protein